MDDTRTIHQWLNDYGESHTNATNELIHWICVPVIFFCVIGFLVSIPSPTLPFVGSAIWAKAAIVAVLWFYLRRSRSLFVAMAIWCLFCLGLALFLQARSAWPLWGICLVLFAAAWIGQFIGHSIEGKKPSFLKDIQFLLIGPAWLMAKIYRRLNISV